MLRPDCCRHTCGLGLLHSNGGPVLSESGGQEKGAVGVVGESKNRRATLNGDAGWMHRGRWGWRESTVARAGDVWEQGCWGQFVIGKEERCRADG